MRRLCSREAHAASKQVRAEARWLATATNRLVGESVSLSAVESIGGSACSFVAAVPPSVPGVSSV